MKKETLSGRRELTWRDRKDMGLTVRELAPVYRELKKSGEIDDESSDGEIAAALSVKMSQKNPMAFKGNIDWDAIIAFIEKMIPLILKLISLFSDD